jgi:uncharacterized protein YecT (DUF1311 family)
MMSTMTMKKLLTTFVTMAALAPAARAADKPDCDSGRTPDIVACVGIETAKWDKRMNAAYQKALKHGEPPRQEQLRTAQRLWASSAMPIASISTWERVPLPASMRPSACGT